MTAPARFTQSDIARALKGANAAGVNVRIEIEPNGKIVIVTQAGLRESSENNTVDVSESPVAATQSLGAPAQMSTPPTPNSFPVSRGKVGAGEAVIGFTGSRYEPIEAQREALLSALIGFREGGALWMHNGDCEGSDAYAGRAWRTIGGKLHLHPPTDPKRRAFLPSDFSEPLRPYLQRNGNIVRACTALVATPREFVEQQRGGTWSTIRLARSLKRPTMIILPNGKWHTENWSHDVKVTA